MHSVTIKFMFQFVSHSCTSCLMHTKVEVGTEHFKKWLCCHPQVKIAVGAKSHLMKLFSSSVQLCQFTTSVYAPRIRVHQQQITQNIQICMTILYFVLSLPNTFKNIVHSWMIGKEPKTSSSIILNL